jgi:regulatory protein
MAGRRARTGRGWDAAPRRATPTRRADGRATRAGRAAPAGSQPATPLGAAQAADPAEAAREICLRSLAVRPRTRAELAAVLRRHGIADEVAADVLDRYQDVGIVDDEAFAKAWVTSRHHGRGLARRALASELRRKGIGSDAAGAALEELDDQTQAQTARALVDHRLRTERRGTPDATFRRMVGMLARKGYPPGLAILVVKQAMAEWTAMSDDLALMIESVEDEAWQADLARDTDPE